MVTAVGTDESAGVDKEFAGGATDCPDSTGWNTVPGIGFVNVTSCVTVGVTTGAGTVWQISSEQLTVGYAIVVHC